MEEHWKQQKLPDNQIFVFNDIISDDLCDEVIHAINKSQTRKERYGPGSNVHGETIIASEIENTQIDSKIYRVVNNIIKKIKKCLIVPVNNDSGYQLRKIEGTTKYHIDGCTSVIDDKNKSFKNHDVRTLSLIIALNSDYEGGEICFPEQNVMLKLEKGQAIAFPPYWTHPHYTTDLLKNTVRYTINTWLTH